MVQFVPYNRGPSFKERIGASLGQLGQNLAEGLLQRQQNMAENEMLAKLSGREASDFQGIGPQFKEKLLQGLMKEQEQAAKTGYQNRLNEVSEEQFKKAYGETLGDIYGSLTTGGKTEFVKQLWDLQSQGYELDEIEDLLSSKKVRQNLEGQPVQEGLSELEASEDDIFEVDSIDKRQRPESVEVQEQFTLGAPLPKNLQVETIATRPKGTTIRDWEKKKERYGKANSELYEKVSDKASSQEELTQITDRLDELNKEGAFPSGLGRAIINPETGKPYGLAQLVGLVPPEMQETVKLLSQLQKGARGTYGARVTNFELESFMQQFPSLLNTPEGVERIIGLLKIQNRINDLRNYATKKVLERYDDTISPIKAQELADSLIKDEVESLKKQFVQSRKDLEGMSSGLRLRGPDGAIYENVPREEYEKNKDQLTGFEIIE